jgi:MinD superfamily P-loop ATPase
MAMLLCWSAKGGSGTTVVACGLALGVPGSTLVDLVGDAPVALGLPEPTSPGVSEWMISPTADLAALRRLRITVNDDVHLLPLGHEPLPADQWARLAAALAALGGVVVDAGNGPPDAALQAAATQSLLVIRPCYLALRRAVALAVRPTGVVLINEPGRALAARDVEHALGVPVVAEVPTDPAISRAVDAGLLAARMPRTLHQPLRRVA